MKVFALAALIITSLYATPIKDYNNLAKRHDSGPPVPGNGETVSSGEKTNITWIDLAYMNPYLNPYYVPVGSVVAIPSNTSWTASQGDSILTISYQFVQYSSYYYYGYYQRANSGYLAKLNEVDSIYEPLESGQKIKLPPGAGYLASFPTTFDHISKSLSFVPDASQK
jgi:hypothetical protein